MEMGMLKAIPAHLYRRLLQNHV